MRGEIEALRALERLVRSVERFQALTTIFSAHHRGESLAVIDAKLTAGALVDGSALMESVGELHGALIDARELLGLEPDPILRRAEMVHDELLRDLRGKAECS